MKRYIPKIIVTILLVALCLPLNIVISNAASKDAKKCSLGIRVRA